MICIGSSSSASGSAVCSFTKRQLDLEFRKVLEACFKNKGEIRIGDTLHNVKPLGGTKCKVKCNVVDIVHVMLVLLFKTLFL